MLTPRPNVPDSGSKFDPLRLYSKQTKVLVRNFTMAMLVSFESGDVLVLEIVNDVMMQHAIRDVSD